MSYYLIMKRSFLFNLFVLVGIICNAQSTELKEAYNNVTSTLKSYKFQSEEVYDAGSYAQTKSITIIIRNGDFVITINDSFGDFRDPFFGHKHGIKTIKVPIDKTKFYLKSYSEKKICISGNAGLEFTYKNKKEILESFSICGEKLTCKKLLQELTELQNIALNEGFIGNLGAATSSPKTSKKNSNSRNGKSNSSSKSVKNNNGLKQYKPKN